MADIAFRQALRAWYEEGTHEARRKVLAAARRQGMDEWDIFKTMLGSDRPFHLAISESEDEDVRAILAIVAEALAFKEPNASSYGMYAIGTDDLGYPEYINGTQYHLGFIDYENPGEKYVIEDRNNMVYHLEDNGPVIVTDQNMVNRILELQTQDMLISAARHYLARQAAGDNDALYRIYYMNINFTNSPIEEPEIVDGIPFWQVGRNASHGFYYGYRDGQLYRMSEYIDWDNEGNRVFEQDVDPVEDFGGYMGHYRRNPQEPSHGLCPDCYEKISGKEISQKRIQEIERNREAKGITVYCAWCRKLLYPPESP